MIIAFRFHRGAYRIINTRSAHLIFFLYIAAFHVYSLPFLAAVYAVKRVSFMLPRVHA